MKMGTKIGFSCCAAGFAIAIYFATSPLLSLLASGSDINPGSIGPIIGIGFCAAGTILGIYFSRKKTNAS